MLYGLSVGLEVKNESASWQPMPHKTLPIASLHRQTPESFLGMLLTDAGHQQRVLLTDDPATHSSWNSVSSASGLWDFGLKIFPLKSFRVVQRTAWSGTLRLKPAPNPKHPKTNNLRLHHTQARPEANSEGMFSPLSACLRFISYVNSSWSDPSAGGTQVTNVHQAL